MAEQIVKKRIGKDIVFRWSIFTNNEAIDLQGRDIKVYLHTPSGDDIQMSPTFSGNVLEFTFKGIQQSEIGVYDITLWENKGKDGQNVLDKHGIIELVSSTELE